MYTQKSLGSWLAIWQRWLLWIKVGIKCLIYSHTGGHLTLVFIWSDKSSKILFMTSIVLNSVRRILRRFNFSSMILSMWQDFNNQSAYQCDDCFTTSHLPTLIYVEHCHICHFLSTSWSNLHRYMAQIYCTLVANINVVVHSNEYTVGLCDLESDLFPSLLTVAFLHIILNASQ